MVALALAFYRAGNEYVGVRLKERVRELLKRIGVQSCSRASV